MVFQSNKLVFWSETGNATGFLEAFRDTIRRIDRA